VKIAFVKKKFSIHGGAERYLQTLIKQFKETGSEIHIFANKWTDEEGVVFHKVEVLPFSSFFSVTSFNSNIKKMIRRGEFDCVISLERTTAQDIYRAGEGCHAEWLKIRSQIEPLYKRLSFKINPLHIALLNIEKEIFLNTPLIVANSMMVKKQIIEHYAAPEDRIKIIYNGVDLERFSPDNKTRRDEIRKSLGIPNNAKALLFVGSGFERKGLRTLLEAVPLIKDRDIRVVVIGRGDVKKYKAIAENKGIADRILFLGARPDIEKFYAAADIFALPTLYDPFSNATLEAMASGIPAITTKNNGAAELIENGREGYVLDNLFDHRELADKINLSLDNLKPMAEAARKKAEAFPIGRAVKEFMDITGLKV
jgi:UDP-glucose:(heptosyl)LPS alpha-1,3-glucosyltransferase